MVEKNIKICIENPEILEKQWLKYKFFEKIMSMQFAKSDTSRKPYCIL